VTAPIGRRITTLVVALVVAAGASLPLAAEDGRQWIFYAGSYNFDQEPTDIEAGLEVRIAGPWRGFSWAGGFAGTDQGSFWAYGGAQYAWHFSERLAIGPGVAVSLYEHGDGKDLGGLVEFRSNVEVSARVGSRSRLGLAVYHFSNAGLYEDNPGSNSLIVSWARSTN